MKLSFTQTRKVLNAIPCINRGGCGFSALALYDAAKREGKEPKIVYLYGWLEDEAMKKNNLFKEGKRKKAYSCSHVVVKIGKNYWDSTGKLKDSELSWYTKDADITRKHLIASLNNRGAWNNCFSRREWGRKIKKLCKKGTEIKA